MSTAFRTGSSRERQAQAQMPVQVQLPMLEPVQQVAAEQEQARERQHRAWCWWRRSGTFFLFFLQP